MASSCGSPGSETGQERLLGMSWEEDMSDGLVRQRRDRAGNDWPKKSKENGPWVLVCALRGRRLLVLSPRYDCLQRCYNLLRSFDTVQDLFQRQLCGSASITLFKLFPPLGGVVLRRRPADLISSYIISVSASR